MNEHNENMNTPIADAKGISGILGNPEGVVRQICAGRRLGAQGAFLLLLALGGTAVFGFGAGCFVDWRVALLDAAKAGGIVLFSYLLCLPTLYVFASIAGCRVGFARLALVGLVGLSGIGCILAALAPVLWLFAVSTESLAFLVLLSFALVIVAVALGARTLGGAVKAQAVNRTTGLSAWFVVFLVVALQAITLVRPMLSPIGAERKPDGKCFFFAHFTHCLVQDLTKGAGK